MPRTFAPSFSRHLRGLMLVGVAIVVVFAVHGNTVTDAFLSDDNRIVAEIQANGPLARWTGPPDVFFRPLVSLLFATDLALYGLDPRGYHVTNLLLHAGVGLWVLALAGIGAQRAGVAAGTRRGLGLLAAGIFWTHPSHSEAVAWISGRGDLLVAFFGLGSVVTYLHWRHANEQQLAGEAPDTRRSPALRWLSLALLIGALASKEAAVALPLVLVTLDGLIHFFRRQRAARQALTTALRGAWWHLAALPVYLVIRAWTIGEVIGGYGTTAHVKPDPLLLGHHLVAFLSRATLPRIDGRQVTNLVFLAVVATLTLAVIATRRRERRAAVRRDDHGDRPTHGDTERSRSAGVGTLIAGLLAAFVLSVLPTLSMRISPISSTSERLIYLPSAYVAVASAAVVCLLLRRGLHRLLAGGLIVALLAIASVRGNRSWHDAAVAVNRVTDAILAIDTADAIYLLTLPASIDGAYVLHNNLQSALALRSPHWQSGWHAPVRVRLPTLNAPVAVSRLKAGVFSIATPEPKVQFQADEHPFVRVTHRRPERFRVGLPQLRRGDWILAWSDGDMITLKRGSVRH